MKMLKKEAEQRQAIEMLCTDMLVPKGHLLRKIDAAVNFARIYELVEDLYCEDNGRPSCDPVVLFKLVMIQHLFGIRSLRQTMRDAEVNVAYRWFLGYTMSQQLPHFATISYAFRHRFTAEVIEGVFRWILEEVARAGYLSAEVVFVDGTHIKANANLKKQMKKAIPVAAKRYQEQLDEEIEADRAAHGKKPLKKDDDDDGPCASGKEKMVAESTTDPESGVFHKGEHKKCFAYEAHTVCDRRGYILETEITPGNVHDSVAFDTVFERLKAHYPEVQVVTADAGYKTPWICKQIFDSGKIPSLPYKRPMTKKGNLPWYAYVYDEYYDCILCPQDKVLSYATTNREGYREYKSKSYICRDCPELEKCTQNRQYTKTVTRHIWQEYLERAEDIRHSPVGKATYALRSQTIERVFADAKEKHAMRYTPYRGLAAVTAWVKLKFAAMNLKKLALHKWRPFLLFYLHLLQEATSLRCNVASLTGCAAGQSGCFQFFNKAVDNDRRQFRQIVFPQLGQQVFVDVTPVYLISGRLDAAQHFIFHPDFHPSGKSDMSVGAFCLPILLQCFLYPEANPALRRTVSHTHSQNESFRSWFSRLHSGPRTARPAACRYSLRVLPFDDSSLSLYSELTAALTAYFFGHPQPCFACFLRIIRLAFVCDRIRR